MTNALVVTQIQNESNADFALSFTEEFLGLVPGANSLMKSLVNLHRVKKLERLKEFFITAQIDEEYLESLLNKESNQEIFMEFIQKISSRTTPLACVALALIYKDESLGDSLKLLAAKALGSISQGALNVFLSCMDMASNNTSKDYQSFTDLVTRKENICNISVKDTGILKEDTEIWAFTSDIISRSLCSSSTIIGDEGQYVGINYFSVIIYNHLCVARTIPEHHS